MIQLDEVVEGYITAALWADCEVGCTCETGDMSQDPSLHSDDCGFGERGGVSHGRVEEDSIDRILTHCQRFIESVPADCLMYGSLRQFNPEDGTVWEHFGHDLRLSEGGHGTGFWDRGLGFVGDRLHSVVEPAVNCWECPGEVVRFDSFPHELQVEA